MNLASIEKKVISDYQVVQEKDIGKNNQAMEWLGQVISATSFTKFFWLIFGKNSLKTT